MKKIYFFFLMVLTTYFLINNIVSAESEPNDTYEQACVIGINSTDSGTLIIGSGTQDADNYDWWKITLPYDGSLYVEAYASGGLTDVELHIYDSNGTIQISSLDISTGPKEATHHSHLKAGTYYIRVARYSGSGNYSIQTIYTQAIYQNDSEPNDIFENAMTLAPNSELYGHIGYYGDNSQDNYDWWKITIPFDGSLKIRTESDSADIELHLYDVNGTTQISTLDISTGLNEETHRNDLKAGTYYLRVALYSKHGGYKLTSTFIPSSIEGVSTNDSEPNDSYSTAVNLGTVSNQSVIINYGHVGYFGNNSTDQYDWWSVTTQTDGKLVIKTLSNESIDIDAYIYDVNGTTQISSLDISTGINEQTHRNDLAAGTYFIRVGAYSGYGAYKISAEFTPTTLANDTEPNEDVQSSIAISPETIMTGHSGYYINSNYDKYDFYSFTLPATWDSLYVRTDSDTDLEIDLSLYNGPYSVVSSAGGSGTKEILSYPNASAGTYYIRIAQYSGQGSYAIKLTNKYPSTQLTDIEEKVENIIPTAFSLKQNYPNPFNPNTKIRYELPKISNVKLIVYDMLGREIQNLVNETKHAGIYEVEFNGSSLTSGVYFFRLTTETYSSTLKMLLLK